MLCNRCFWDKLLYSNASFYSLHSASSSLTSHNSTDGTALCSALKGGEQLAVEHVPTTITDMTVYLQLYPRRSDASSATDPRCSFSFTYAPFD